MINFMYMIENTIAQLFTRAVGKWQGQLGTDGKPTERKALLVQFRMKRESVYMLIHAPANYVGVYIRKEKEKGWNCLVYHDSCWKSDGVNRFLWENRENIQFCFFPLASGKGWDIAESITDSIHVVKLSEVQLDGLKQVRKKKYS